MMKHNNLDLSEQICRLYAITNELEELFPGRKFTPDGHLVGSIGEALVADRYGLSLLPNAAKTHDALTADGKMVQIKATQGNRIALSSEPDYLIVIQISKTGSWQEVYSGPGKPVWENAGKMQKNGQRPISLSKLMSLANGIRAAERIMPKA